MSSLAKVRPLTSNSPGDGSHGTTTNDVTGSEDKVVTAVQSDKSTSSSGVKDAALFERCFQRLVRVPSVAQLEDGGGLSRSSLRCRLTHLALAVASPLSLVLILSGLLILDGVRAMKWAPPCPVHAGGDLLELLTTVRRERALAAFTQEYHNLQYPLCAEEWKEAQERTDRLLRSSLADHLQCLNNQSNNSSTAPDAETSASILCTTVGRLNQVRLQVRAGKSTLAVAYTVYVHLVNDIVHVMLDPIAPLLVGEGSSRRAHSLIREIYSAVEGIRSILSHSQVKANASHLTRVVFTCNETALADIVGLELEAHMESSCDVRLPKGDIQICSHNSSLNASVSCEFQLQADETAIDNATEDNLLRLLSLLTLDGQGCATNNNASLSASPFALANIVVPPLVLVVALLVGAYAAVFVGRELRSAAERTSAFVALVQRRNAQLIEEKHRSEALIHQMLPKTIADQLMAGKTVDAESFEGVSLYFSDIVGFNGVALTSSPILVVDLLNALYGAFDECVERYDVYKVETVADQYLVASGLPERNADRHAREIASLALDMMQKAADYSLPGSTDSLPLRVGLNTGPIVTGVIGLRNPRYCLFGDTINTASRMESTGEAYRIHSSESFKDAVDKTGDFTFELRGSINVKGKGAMTTYWLTGHKIIV